MMNGCDEVEIDPYIAVKKLPKNHPDRTVHTPSYNILIVFGSLTYALKDLLVELII